jgi:RNA polymerase sigma-70 factor (ECF subfamily)
MTRLVDVLLSRHGGISEAEGREILEQDLQRLVHDAAAAAPGVRLDPERFIAHVARWLPLDRPPQEALAALRLDQLYLACAAAEGQAAAIAKIEQHHFDRAAAALRSLGSVADEALQRVREHLFVARPGRLPKIADYAGRGELAGWIRTTAMREAFHLLAPSREVPADDRALGGYALPAADPAVELMKRRYGASFKQALADALARLPEETRAELRRYYLEGLGLEQIAALEGVAASTVSRRLEKARRTLHDETRRSLAASLRIADDEVDSILRVLDSRLELSRGALADEAP